MTENNGTKSSSKPQKYDERKLIRSLSITNKAWNAIKDKSALEGVSASEFIERIGRDASVLETPIHSRLKGFLEPPIAIFWCLSEAVRRFALQLGLVKDFTEKELKKYEIEERIQQQKDIVADCLWRSMLILALINYGIPELNINSMTPLLRWMSFKVLLCKAKQNMSILLNTDEPVLKITEQQIEDDLVQIQTAFNLLQSFSPSYYQILEMTIKGKMTFAQIAKYKCLNTQKNVTEAEVRREARQAADQIRSYLHNEVLEMAKRQDTGNFCESHNSLSISKRKYYQLCSLPCLLEEEKKSLEELLGSALSSPELEFWIREIDHLAGHHYLGTFESAHINTKYKDIHYELFKELGIKLKEGDILQNKLTEMDKKLMFCKSLDDIRDTVGHFVLEISQGSFQLSDIPFPLATSMEQLY